jgi:uncharacterized protein (DUF1800 family)
LYGGSFGPRQAERLLWRAGFGPVPGQGAELAQLGLKGAILALTRPAGDAVLTGPEPTIDDGSPIAPYEARGEEHLYWLDRMVRTNQPFRERMALVWHDWFATSIATVNSQRFMIEQYELFRARGLGSFGDLLEQVTAGPAMLLWLNGLRSRAEAPNENYGREVMELFTLGADRGAYTEDDVREMARALTGWEATRVDGWWDDFRFDPAYHDAGTKTIFGNTGSFDWRDAAHLCVSHPLHRSFLVRKLWSYFIAAPLSRVDRVALARLYVSSGQRIRPLVEAILAHPALYQGPPMVKPPVVYVAGMLRALQRGIDTRIWIDRCDRAGQRLFFPPNVSGWADDLWLDTSTIHARWICAREAFRPWLLEGSALSGYDPAETAEQALDAAIAFCGNPQLSAETQAPLLAFAEDCVAGPLSARQKPIYRGMRQNALRQLILASPDLQVS